MSPDLYREMAQTQHHHWWFKARREILAQVITRFKLPIDSEILEIGAGAGGNLSMLSRYGRVTAVEGDPFARHYASDISGIAVHPGHLPDGLPFEDASFDLICLFDVLEHTEDDLAGLEAIRRLLRPEGRVLITAPAYQWLYGAHDRAHHHFRRYTARRLCNIARGSGLRVIRSGYFNTLLFPLIALRRVQQIALGGSEGHDASLPPALVNGALYGVFSIEKYIAPVRLFPFGTSVLAVLTRDDLDS